MSKEFEELVLKKLDSLEEKTTNTDRVIQEVILPKLDKIDILEEKIINTDKTLQEISTELKNTQKELRITQEGLENLTNKFIVFDFEINKRIDTLFDAFTLNREKDLVHEKDIKSLEYNLYEIEVLDDSKDDIDVIMDDLKESNTMPNFNLTDFIHYLQSHTFTFSHTVHSYLPLIAISLPTFYWHPTSISQSSHQ